MTRDEYIAMKERGQFSLECFYEYFVDHLHAARDQTRRTFEEFSEAFPLWWNGPGSWSKSGTIYRITVYFDEKFGVDLQSPGGEAPFMNNNPFRQ